MHAPHRPADGLEIIGAVTIKPSISNDKIDRLEAINMASMQAALDERPSTVTDELAPGHPEGPNPWVACEAGCCLELARHGYLRTDSIEPWLDYLVRELFSDHQCSGSVVMRDCADDVVSALVIDRGRVRRKTLLGDGRRGTAPRAVAVSSGGAQLRGV